jgi:hypothetical protein
MLVWHDIAKPKESARIKFKPVPVALGGSVDGLTEYWVSGVWNMIHG